MYENVEEYLDAITPKKYIIPDFNETSEAELRTVIQMTNL